MQGTLQVMGVTDVDDKIINRAKADGQIGTVGAAGLAGKYEKLFLKDMRLLGVLPPDSLTRVSEFIPDIIAFIADLQRLKFAYVGSGSGKNVALPHAVFTRKKWSRRTNMHQFQQRCAEGDAIASQPF